MIREANIKDIPSLIKRGPHFFKHAGFEDKGLIFDEDSTYKTLQFLITDENGIVLVNEDKKINGFIYGLLSPFPLNYNQIILTEFAWWVDPTARNTTGLKLLKEFEKEGIIKGATLMVMVTSDSFQEEKLKKFYKKKGFKHLEHHYIKRL
jgi:hypothetical protein